MKRIGKAQAIFNETRPSQYTSSIIEDDLLVSQMRRFAHAVVVQRRCVSNVPGVLEARRRLDRRRMGSALPSWNGTQYADFLPNLELPAIGLGQKTGPESILGLLMPEWLRSPQGRIRGGDQEMADGPLTHQSEQRHLFVEELKQCSNLSQARILVQKHGISALAYSKFIFAHLIAQERAMAELLEFLDDPSLNYAPARNLGRLLERQRQRLSSDAMSSNIDSWCDWARRKIAALAMNADSLLHLCEHCCRLSTVQCHEASAAKLFDAMIHALLLKRSYFFGIMGKPTIVALLDGMARRESEVQARYMNAILRVIVENDPRAIDQPNSPAKLFLVQIMRHVVSRYRAFGFGCEQTITMTQNILLDLPRPLTMRLLRGITRRLCEIDKSSFNQLALYGGINQWLKDLEMLGLIRDESFFQQNSHHFKKLCWSQPELARIICADLTLSTTLRLGTSFVVSKTPSSLCTNAPILGSDATGSSHSDKVPAYVSQTLTSGNSAIHPAHSKRVLQFLNLLRSLGFARMASKIVAHLEETAPLPLRIVEAYLDATNPRDLQHDLTIFRAIPRLTAEFCPRLVQVIAETPGVPHSAVWHYALNERQRRNESSIAANNLTKPAINQAFTAFRSKTNGPFQVKDHEQRSCLRTNMKIKSGEDIFSPREQHARLLGALALAFSQRSDLTDRQRFRQIHTCYLNHVKQRLGPLHADLCCALVYSGILGPLGAGRLVSPKRTRWMLARIEDTYGQEHVQQIHQVVETWRHSALEKHQKQQRLLELHTATSYGPASYDS